MFGSVMLEVIVSMAFLYLILSLACSALNEMIATALRLRSKDLAAGVQSLVGSAARRDKLLNHGLIKALARNPGKKIDPSYIPSRTFALALLDQLAEQGRKPPERQPGSEPAKPESAAAEPPGGKPKEPRVADVQAGLQRADSSGMAESLNALIKEAGDDLKALQAGVERWFNDTMDRAGGWYKRKIQIILFALSLIVTVGLNVDTVMMSNALLRDATLRETVVAAAQQYVQRAKADTATAGSPSVAALQTQLSSLQLPIGWGYGPTPPKLKADPIWWLTKLLGLAITTLAVSLGAPFWFDVLNKVSKLRTVGVKPDGTEKTKK